MTKEQIVEMVLSCEPPINLTVQPGFDSMRWYLAKAVEITTKVVLKDFELCLHEENDSLRNKENDSWKRY